MNYEQKVVQFVVPPVHLPLRRDLPADSLSPHDWTSLSEGEYSPSVSESAKYLAKYFANGQTSWHCVLGIISKFPLQARPRLRDWDQLSLYLYWKIGIQMLLGLIPQMSAISWSEVVTALTIFASDGLFNLAVRGFTLAFVVASLRTHECRNQSVEHSCRRF